MFTSSAIVGLIVLFISQLSLSGVLSETKPNIEFLGSGYDVLKGNPHTNYLDPGFRQPVLKIQNNEAASGGSGKWLIPGGVQLVSETEKQSCSYSPVVDTVSDYISYSHLLSRDVVIHGSGFDEKFSDSDLFRDMKIDTSNYGRKYVVSVTKCSIYEAYFDSHGPGVKIAKPNGSSVLTEAVVSALEDLPVVGGESKYRQFIDTFGTHYVGRVRAGAKTVWLNAFDPSTWVALRDAGFNFSAAASASFIASAGDGQASLSEVEVRLQNTFESNVSYVRKNYIGGLPYGDRKWEGWTQFVEVAPQPIEYDVFPLTNLLTNELLPQIAPETLLNITMRLTTLFHKSKISTKTWTARGAGRRLRRATEVSMTEVKQEYTGTTTVSCPAGHSLLSCGISNTQYDRPDPHRHAIPVSSSACQCRDTAGASCHALCADARLSQVAKSSRRQGGTFSVNCPRGSKVTGCHISTPSNNEADYWRSHYPTADGNGCTCDARYGADCIASCVNNLESHEVRSVSGSHAFTVSCASPNMILLGCGMRSDRLKKAEVFRMFHVSSPTSCACYDYFGATCYAICGKFN